MNGLKLLVSALVAVMAIIVFGAGEVAWREGSFMCWHAGGGYGAAREHSARSIAGASDDHFGGRGHDRRFFIGAGRMAWCSPCLPFEEYCRDGPRDREPQQQHEQVLETLESRAGQSESPPPRR